MLSTRIHCLMDWNPGPALLRPRAGLVVALCALTVAAFAACKLERAVKPAPGQPTMNELERRMAERNKEWNQKRERMLDEVHKLTLEQAQALEMQVKADTQDRDKILKLVRYYQYKVDLKDLDALTLWFIEHRSDQPWAWNINPEWDHDGLDEEPFSRVSISFDLNVCPGRITINAFCKNTPGQLLRYLHSGGELPGRSAHEIPSCRCSGQKPLQSS